MDIDKEIEKIVEGIGSPYGEGATYSSGSEPSHLDSDDKPLLRKDVKSLISSVLDEITPKKQRHNDKCGYECSTTGFNDCIGRINSKRKQLGV